MVKGLFTAFLLLIAGITYTQVNAIFPLAAKRGMRTGAFSLNGQYAFLSNASYETSPINLSVFDVKAQKPIRNVQINSDQGLEAWNISNDGRYILMNDGDGYGYRFVYDLQSDTLLEKEPGSSVYDIPLSNQEIHDQFYPNGDDHDHYEYWFSNHFSVRADKETLSVFDHISERISNYDLAAFEGLKNTDNNELCLSENGELMGYSSKSNYFVYRLKDQKLVFSGELNVSNVQEIAIDNNGTICLLGYFEDDKDLGLHWYDIKSKKFIENSTKDGLLNLSYVSQFYKFMTVGMGTEDKKRVQQTQFIDLSSGEFSAIVQGKGWSSFNEVQEFVKDTLSRSILSDDEFNYVNGSRVYYTYYEMRDDYFNKEDQFEIQTSNPQVTEDFFAFIDEKDWQISVLTAHENKVTFQNTSGDIGFFGVFLKKKMVYFWNGNMGSEKEKLVQLFITQNMEPVFFCDDNYYYCPSGMSNVIGFEQDFKYYPAEQFDLKYNRPDIILDRLGYADSSLISAYHQAYKKRLKKMGFAEEMLEDDFHLPEIDIENYEEMPTLHDQGSIHLKLHLQDSKYKLDRINVWVNDVAVYGADGISLRDENVQEYSTDLEVFLAKGKNKVQVSVLNQAGAESYKETFEVECTVGKNKPDLYLITIGESEFQQADFNLTYAAKDAQDMVSLFEKSKVYENVFTKTLVNNQVTKENVMALSSFIEKANINDEVMIFIAGHGVLDANLDYYFATYDMDFQHPEERGLAYDDLESLLDGIQPLKKTLLIDACHSGEIDKDEVQLAEAEVEETDDIQFRVVGNTASPKLGTQNTSELTKSLFTDLRKGTGATVISSAGGMEFAIEGDDWNNGLFTYCFINGIKSKAADYNNDGEIWLSEIQQYVAQQVYKLSGGRQQPTSRIENQTVDFRVW